MTCLAISAATFSQTNCAQHGVTIVDSFMALIYLTTLPPPSFHATMLHVWVLIICAHPDMHILKNVTSYWLHHILSGIVWGGDPHPSPLLTGAHTHTCCFQACGHMPTFVRDAHTDPVDTCIFSSLVVHIFLTCVKMLHIGRRVWNGVICWECLHLRAGNWRTPHFAKMLHIGRRVWSGVICWNVCIALRGIDGRITCAKMLQIGAGSLAGIFCIAD